MRPYKTIAVAILVLTTSAFSDSYRIFSLDDILKDQGTEGGFIRPIGYYIFNMKNGIFSTPKKDQSELLSAKCYFLMVSKTIDLNSVSDVTLKVNLLELQKYPLIWLRISVMDDKSKEFVTAENPSGSEWSEWKVGTDSYQDESEINALTLSRKVGIILYNPINKSLIVYNMQQNTEKNKVLIEKARKLLKTKYKTNADMHHAVNELLRKYPIAVEMVDE